MVQLLWKTVQQFLTKLSILFPYSPAIVLVSIYPKELKTYVHKNNLYTNVCGRLIIVKTWRQPRYPSIGEWLNKLWYIDTMEFYSAMKKSLSLCDNMDGT